MKFKDYLTETRDPPMLLQLRRIAIRNFPSGERVALFANPQLNIKLAIPYDAASGKLKPTNALPIKEEQQINEKSHILYGEWEDHAKQLGAVRFKHHPAPEEFEGSNGHTIAYNAGGHITGTWNHDYRIGNVQEQYIDERFSTRIMKDYADWHDAAEKKGTNQFKIHNNARSTSAFRNNKLIGTYNHDQNVGHLREAAIHRINTILRTGKEDNVIFKNGAANRVHPKTAQVVHNLFHKVNSSNKNKLAELINSSPEGLEKVAKFANDVLSKEVKK